MADDSKWIGIQLSEVAKIPEDTEFVHVFRDRWWNVKDGKIWFYKSFCHPQCNGNRSIAARLGQKDNCETVFLPLVLVPHKCEDYL